MTRVQALGSAALLSGGLLVGYLLALSQAPQGQAPWREPVASATQKEQVGRPSADNARPVRRGDEAPPTANSLAEIVTIEGDFDQTLALYQLIARDDVPMLVQRLQRLPGALLPQDRAAAGAILLGRLAELDPDTALSYVLDHPELAQQRWLRTVFFSWAKTDLNAALAAIESLPKPFRRGAASAVLQARDDMVASERAAIAQRFDLRGVPLVQAGNFVDGWLQAQQLSDRKIRLQQQQQVLAAWADVSPEAAWAAVQEVSGQQDKTYLKREVLTRWIERDPAVVLDLLQSDPTIAGQDRLFTRALAALAERDVDAAMARFDVLPEALQQRARSALAEPLAKADPERLKAWLETSEDRRFEMRAYRYLFATAAESTNAADFAWIQSLPQAKAELAERFLIQALAQSSPQAALGQLETLPLGRRRTQAVATLANTWATSEPVAAAAWVESLPAAEQELVLPNVLSRWAQSDFEAAEQRWQQVSSPALRERVAVDLLQQAPDPASFERLLAAVRSADQRRSALVRGFPRLEQMDAAAAQSYRAEYDAISGTRRGVAGGALR